MKKLVGILVAGMIGFVPFVSADEFAHSVDLACAKQQQCAMAEMAKDPSITPEQRKMAERMMGGACQMMAAEFEPMRAHPDVFSKASECLRSMAELSCDQLINFSGETKACQAFNAAAEKIQ